MLLWWCDDVGDRQVLHAAAPTPPAWARRRSTSLRIRGSTAAATRRSTVRKEGYVETIGMATFADRLRSPARAVMHIKRHPGRHPSRARLATSGRAMRFHGGGTVRRNQLINVGRARSAAPSRPRWTNDRRAALHRRRRDTVGLANAIPPISIVVANGVSTRRSGRQVPPIRSARS